MRPRLRRHLQPLVDVSRRLRTLATPSHHPLNAGERVDPVFIVGSGRSGNTLLRRILCAGGEIHIPPEMYVLPEVIHLWRRRRHESWPDLQRSLLARFEFHEEFDKFDICLQPLARELDATPSAQRSLAHVLDAFYRFHARARGSEVARWGDKTPYNTGALPYIDRVFPDARYVHVLRDGVDVVHSYVASGRYETPDAAARRWRGAVRSVRSFCRGHDTRCHEVRYERLVQDPDREVESVCRFLGLAFTPAMIDDLARVDSMGDVGRKPHHANVKEPIMTASIGKGRRALRPELQKQLQRLIGPDLAACGYAPATDARGSGTQED